MIAIHWFRRDLRLEDNTALLHALAGDLPVLPVFIFDSNILEELPEDDARLSFIYKELQNIHERLQEKGSGIVALHGDPLAIWSAWLLQYPAKAVYWNRDYEPYARERDGAVFQLLEKNGIAVHAFKDQVIFEEDEVMKNDGLPYTVFTPYKRKWLEQYAQYRLKVPLQVSWNNFYQTSLTFPSLEKIGFKKSSIHVKEHDLSRIVEYGSTRDFPAKDSTSYLGPHLRFGTVSIRKILNRLNAAHEAFLNEFIWREFFMQILYHFPKVVTENFHKKYDGVTWRNNTDQFELWRMGKTGYPLVDAGIRQLNQTGYMHNRVRMVAASFLCKHLLIDWRWGEAYFAKKLLDYELSSNNGNWQWAAGTGCDAAPYFRIFNPVEQQKKFDEDFQYVKKWVPEYGTNNYPNPMIDHRFARKRALETYRKGIQAK